MSRAMVATGIRVALALVAAVGAGNGTTAHATTFAAELPELARPGPQAVGTTLTATAGATVERVSYRVWYPATPPRAGPRMRYRHRLERPGHPAIELEYAGRAVPDAAVATGRFPLLVMSHGYGNWATRFAGLAETLASQGYVVAAIEHRDAPATDPASFRASFARVLEKRSAEQRLVIADVVARSRARAAGFAQAVDPSAIGLLGYSMGGYGALITAGACPEGKAPAFAGLTGQARDRLANCSGAPPDLKALILLAPWGGAPNVRMWSEAALARIAIPTFLVSGSEDDVVDYRDGVRWLHDGLSRSDRRLLVYREARHNIVGDSWSGLDTADFAAREAIVEPVWRGERLSAINAHFIVAFLDLTLKGMRSRQDWLDVPVANANDGRWPQPSGVGGPPGAVAGTGEAGYWRGFQRRWAVGLELTHTPPAR